MGILGILTTYSMKIYNITCKICSYVGNSKHKTICQPCYRKQWAKNAPKKECGQCGDIQQLTKGICHKCYEFNRRQKIIEEAKTDPEKAKKLKEQREREYIKSKAKGHYSSLKRRISSQIDAYKSRDLECDLDREWFLDNIVDKNCAYCGIDEKTAKLITGNNLHVDKKVPEKGYKKDNCVPACKACNTAKLNIWSFEETCELGKVIAKFYESRKANE